MFPIRAVLLCAAITLAADQAAAQQARVIAIPPGKNFKPNGRLHPEVEKGLKAPEGSELRYRAEMCVPFPEADQEACMAAAKEKAAAAAPSANATPPGWKFQNPVEEERGGAGAGGKHALCRQNWGSNHVMREHCDREQDAARWRKGY